MTPTPPLTSVKRRTRTGEYLAVLVIIALVIAIAFFQEPLGAYFRLRLWDKGAPGRVVEEFMSAVQKGDQQKAQSALAAPEMKPLTKDGKWIGYYMETLAGRLDFLPQDLAPIQGAPTVSAPEFNPEGGAAEVTTTVGSGKPLKYRLKMNGGSWKIVEILGGRIHHK